MITAIVFGQSDGAQIPEVAEQIAEYRDVLGPNGHFIARSYFPGLDPGIQRETVRIFGEEVRNLLG